MLLEHSEWQSLELAHERRADALTAGHRERKRLGIKHPVEDFLWTYYSVKPTELRRWHPGGGVVLAEAASDRASWRYYASCGEAPGSGATAPHATVDVITFFASRGGTVDYVEDLLQRTLGHAPRFGCFGLHEWAMVYRMTPEQLRHAQLPLRIGHAETDRVVESHTIGCSHFDAYRFFTREATPRNTMRPTRETQAQFEQSGCLHAGMDIYKWAAKLGPIVPGEVLLDAFELARDIREVDMRASPYDVTGIAGADGELLTAIPIETGDGKREYTELQRGFAARGDSLRHRVLSAIAAARLAATAPAAAAR